MNDDEKQLPNEENPEGMVRRTRKVRKKRRSSSSGSEKDANSLFSKAKDLLIGMQDEDEDYGPVDVAEQVRRLKKRKGNDDKPLDDTWGTKKRSSSWLWIVLIGIIAPVVAIIIGISMLSDDDTGTVLVNPDELADVSQTIFDPGEGPMGWYNANSVGVIDEAIKIINLCNSAKSPKEIESYVRSSPYRKVNPLDLNDWGVECLTNSLSGFQWNGMTVRYPGGVAEMDRGVLVVSGTRKNKEPFQCFFVYEDAKVVLDWEATTGWSEMPVEEIREIKPRKETLVRCLIEKRPSYDLSFGEIPYSGYLVSSPNKDEYFMAYFPLNSDQNKQLDRDLKIALNYGSFTGQPLLKDQPVTLRVRFNDAVGMEGILEITALEQAGWVRP